MARLTLLASFFVLVFEPSGTSKLMIVTHFQRFFMCPGAPKKEPKGQPNFICCVSFFDLGPNGAQGGVQEVPKGTQKGSRGTQKGSKGGQGGPKRNPGEPKRRPGGAQGYPKGSPRGAQGTQKGSWGICLRHGGGKTAGNWINILIYVS